MDSHHRLRFQRAPSCSLLHSARKLVEPEVVATSPYRIKSPMPVCCGFSSASKRASSGRSLPPASSVKHGPLELLRDQRWLNRKGRSEKAEVRWLDYPSHRSLQTSPLEKWRKAVDSHHIPQKGTRCLANSASTLVWLTLHKFGRRGENCTPKAARF